MRLIWVTDIHLNFLGAHQEQVFFQSVLAARPDVVLVGGDIGEANNFEDHLNRFSMAVGRPIYFVLGNHDFYGGNIAAVRARCRAVTEGASTSPTPLQWLPALGVVPLSEHTALVGHDGWGDARLGNVEGTPVVLNDFVHIEDLRTANPDALRRRLQALGDEAAAYLRDVVADALATFRHLIVLTHVPPFEAACWHEGRVSDADWLPYFTCAAVGDVLRNAMAERPECTMHVLCGHTHGGGVARILPNLLVWTGASEYGAPQVQEPVPVSSSG